MVVLDEEIYFIGGKRGKDILSGIGEAIGGYYVDNVCMSYNIATKEWKEKSSIPKNYVNISVLALDDKIYSVARYQNNVTILYYHPNTDKWYHSEINLMNRKSVKTAISKNNIIVLGGIKNVNSFILPEFISDAIEVINVNEIIKYGDVNQDGFINSVDYTLIHRYVLGIITKFPSDAGEIVADINKDGKIDSRDNVVLKRYILNIINDF